MRLSHKFTVIGNILSVLFYSSCMNSLHLFSSKFSFCNEYKRPDSAFICTNINWSNIGTPTRFTVLSLRTGSDAKNANQHALIKIRNLGNHSCFCLSQVWKQSSTIVSSPSPHLPCTPGCVQYHLLPALLSILSHICDFILHFPLFFPNLVSLLHFLYTLPMPVFAFLLLAIPPEFLKWAVVKDSIGKATEWEQS